MIMGAIVPWFIFYLWGIENFNPLSPVGSDAGKYITYEELEHTIVDFNIV